MPYAKKFNHYWNLQWQYSPFMEYARSKRRRAHRKDGAMSAMATLLMVNTVLKGVTYGGQDY